MCKIVKSVVHMHTMIWMFVCQWYTITGTKSIGILVSALYLFGVCEQIAKVSSSRYFDYLTEINIDSSPRHTNHSLGIVLFTKKYKHQALWPFRHIQRHFNWKLCDAWNACVVWIHPLNSSLVEAEYHSVIKITEPKGIFGFSSHHHQVYFMHGQIQIEIDYRKTNVFDMRLNLDISWYLTIYPFPHMNRNCWFKC